MSVLFDLPPMMNLDLPPTEGLQAVARGEVEFGVNIMGAPDPDLIFDQLVEDAFALAVRKGDPFAARESLTWALAPYSLITVHRSSATASCTIRCWPSRG